jgi:23S rRNA (uridine2552-2'-O)-methyltransferase
MKRSKSSARWLNEHVNDEYVKLAQKLGYRSRAIFKLEELNERDHLLRPGMTVIDLGSAPGSWSQMAAKIVGPKGKIVALDILPMDALADVDFLQGDFREEAVMEQLIAMLEGRQVDLVMSDMAPNISGVKISDQARAMYLIELAMDLATRVLRPGGDLLVKVFQGEGFDQFVRECRRHFASVVIRKPKASRSRSPEVYLLARNYTV